MLKFDKVKIVAPSYLISDIDESAFMMKVLNGELKSWEYKQAKPYNLSIRHDITHKELSIEFTGKILGDDYPLLITRDTIRECLNNVNAMGIAAIDVDGLLQSGKITKCDITQDVEFSDIDGLVTYAKTNLSNYSKWIAKKYHNGVCICNTVTTARYKRSVVIYDKSHELSMSSNQEFLATLKDKDTLIDYFKGKVRFERNINTEEELRKALNIPNTSVATVLNAEASPITDLLTQAVIVKTDSLPSARNSKEQDYEIILRYYDYDLKKLEMAKRAVISKTTSIRKIMKPYEDYMNRRADLISGSFDFGQLISQMTYSDKSQELQ